MAEDITYKQNTVKCPYCAETVQKVAKFCRYCGKRIKGVVFRRAIFIFLFLSILVILFMNTRHIMIITRDFKTALQDIRNLIGTITEALKGLT